MALERAGVIPRHDGGVEDLFEGVAAGLSGLELDHVQERVLALQHQVVEAEQDPLALGEVRLPPALLRPARPLDRQLDIVVGAARDGAEQPAVGRILDLERLVLAIPPRDAVGQLLEPPGIDPL
jgi:hypothetical protein